MSFIENPEEPASLNFIHCNRDIIVNQNGSLPSWEQLHEIKRNFSHLVFFKDSENDFVSLELPEQTNLKELPSEFKCIPLREFFAGNDERSINLAARSRTIGKWLFSMNFCPVCGKPLSLSHSLSCKICTSCEKEFFPRIEPAVIVLVKKGEEMLLARHKNRNQNVWACIAGFVEAGETIEQAVHREVLEETGIKIKNLKYKGSQSWPFPDQLMFAFTAEYESGEIHVQQEELSEARWLSQKDNPATPLEGSVAYRLIHDQF